MRGVIRARGLLGFSISILVLWAIPGCGHSPSSNCQPKTCQGVGATCGQIDDGCGATLQCGTCSPPQTCGGGGQANLCGASTTPTVDPIDALAPKLDLTVATDIATGTAFLYTGDNPTQVGVAPGDDSGEPGRGPSRQRSGPEWPIDS